MFSLHHNPSVTLRVPPPFTQGRLRLNRSLISDAVLMIFQGGFFLLHEGGEGLGGGF